MFSKYISSAPFTPTFVAEHRPQRIFLLKEGKAYSWDEVATGTYSKIGVEMCY